MVDVCTVDRPGQLGKNRGASAVCAMMHSMMFASGGYDHAVHLWDASQDVSRPTPSPLAIRHTSTVQTLLAIRDTSHKLVSGGADCNVHIYDLSSERVVNTLKTSNSVYHAHEAISPFCTLLEVSSVVLMPDWESGNLIHSAHRWHIENYSSRSATIDWFLRSQSNDSATRRRRYTVDTSKVGCHGASCGLVRSCVSHSRR